MLFNVLNYRRKRLGIIDWFLFPLALLCANNVVQGPKRTGIFQIVTRVFKGVSFLYLNRFRKHSCFCPKAGLTGGITNKLFIFSIKLKSCCNRYHIIEIALLTLWNNGMFLPTREVFLKKVYSFKDCGLPTLVEANKSKNLVLPASTKIDIELINALIILNTESDVVHWLDCSSLPFAMSIKVKYHVSMTLKDDFYTAEELATKLKLNVMTIYRYIKAGKLKAHKIGKEYRIGRTEFERFINSTKTK